MTGFGDLNLKFPWIAKLAISVFMSSQHFMLSQVEHVKSFITSGITKTGSLICKMQT